MTTRRLAAIALLLLLTGCGAARGGSVGEVARAEQICAGIESQLREHPDVVDVHVQFLHTAVNPGDATARVQVRPGAGRSAAEVTVKLIWLSELDPLRRISVTLADGTTEEVVATYELPDDSAKLAEQYGERVHQDREFDAGQATLVLGLVGLAALVVVGVLVAVAVILWRRSARQRATPMVDGSTPR